DRDNELYPNQYALEIATNAQQWLEITANSIGYESVNPEKIEFGLPINPWPHQKYQVRFGSEDQGNLRGNDGTARTWHKYQTLINLIFGESLSRNERLTFHRKSFHTDMSDEAAKKHTETNSSSAVSVEKRIKLLSYPFFRSFPIVIAAVGHFPHDSYGDEYFKTVFGVDFIGNQSVDGMPWINVNERTGNQPQLVIHCPQFAAPLSNDYLEQISKIVRDFAQKHGINLNPSE
ncbi:MAG: hypothetical protein K2O88_08760, partial [Paramuribaculum sp.]|nr:hypothetical protein [Paramuribaculum sp.]